MLNLPKYFLVLSIFLLISCGGETIPGKPMSIGLKPIETFYGDFVYQETSNEYFAAGSGEISLGILMFNKFGEQSFLVFDTEKKLEPIKGNWAISGRKIYFYSEEKLIAEGEGMQFPERAPLIDLQVFPFKFLVSSKVTLQKRYLRLENYENVKIEPEFIFQNEENTASGNCLIGEDPSGELSIILRLYHNEDEDEEDESDGNGKIFELINIKKRNRPILFKNGYWIQHLNEIEFKFHDGKILGTGSFKQFLGQPIIRLKSKIFKLSSSEKELNLFLIPKNECTR